MFAYFRSGLWYLVWGFVALYLIMTIGMWAATLRTLGFSSLVQCPRMLRLSFRALPIRELSLALVLPALAILLIRKFEIGGRYLEALPLNAPLWIGLLCFTLFLLPPTALVLSSSTDKQLRWALGLKKFTGGRRVVSLLDTEFMKPQRSISDVWSITLRRSSALTDVLRMSNTSGWQAGVRELIELSPIVILDTRVCTPAILFEASLLLTSEYAYKTIFMTEDDNACPVLERLVDEKRISSECLISVIKESELGALLKRLLASRDSLPKPGSFASAPSTIGKSVAQRRTSD